jgi:hypothetical protein
VAGSLSMVGVAVAASPSSATDVATFHGVTPARLMDTRGDQPTIDGLFAGTGPVLGGNTVDVRVLGRGGVPAMGVGAVALNVTVTAPTATGYVTVFPTGAARPNASNLNYTAGQTIPNMVIVAVGADSSVSLFNSTSGSASLLVDVLGWFPLADAFTGVVPARLMDTREGYATIDGVSAATGAVGGSSTVQFTAAGRGGVPTTGVGAVALNVTVTSPTTVGYLTVYPAGAARPTASNLNFTPGLTIPNMVIVPLGAGGQVSVFNGGSGTAHVVVDVLGWFPVGSAFSGLTPARLLDTRVGQPTIDGKFSGYRSIRRTSALNLVVTGRGGVPATGAGAVALNVTVTNPTSNAYLTVYPGGSGVRPTASNLNFVTGQTIPNMVIVPVGTDGQVTIYNSSDGTDLVVDVLGWFPNPTVPPTSFGNELRLKVDGFGPLAFMTATPADALGLLNPFLGIPPNLDRVEEFPTFIPDRNVYENPTSGDQFKYNRGRQLCWTAEPTSIGLCLFFGQVTPTQMLFVGYFYYGDSGSRFFDVNGLSVGARAADFPGAFTVPAAGCYSFSASSTPSGVYLELQSKGAPFGYFDEARNVFVNQMPPATDVYVDGFDAGDQYIYEGDC